MTKIKILCVNDILKQAIEEVKKCYSVSELKELVENQKFSDVTVRLEQAAHKIYRKAERKALKSHLSKKGLKPKIAEKAVKIFLDEDIGTSIANIRRSRAGSTSEAILRIMLDAAGIKCEKGKVKMGGYRPDVAIPSNAKLKKSKKKGIAISIKRTLRERWAEDIDVFKFPNGKFVLITPDPDFKEDKAKDMLARGMREVYIPDKLYDTSSFISKYPQFKKLSDLPKDIITFLNKQKTTSTY